MNDPAPYWTYSHPSGVEPVLAGRRPALTTPSGGKVTVDRSIQQLWQAAAGRNFTELISWGTDAGWEPSELAATVAALVTADLLHRDGELRHRLLENKGAALAQSSEPVSVIIVSYNSRAWLPGCFASLHAQTCAPLEIIVVDNGSTDDSVEWLKKYEPATRLLHRSPGGSLASALNFAIHAAAGEYYLILNPDVTLDENALASMLVIAQSDPRCAAVAAKLRLLWAPAFFNGLGNSVGAFSYGTDSALGHLDLGQFDAWDELPSACFAAALLSAAAVAEVGALDEGFPMYYEDVEWCYRARLLGWTVRAASGALVHHAFSGNTAGGEDHGLSANKLRNVTYGRLRFITLLAEDPTLKRVRSRYRIQDRLGWMIARLRGRDELARAYQSAWEQYQRETTELEARRRELQAHRVISDNALFALQRNVPMPLVHRGLPIFTTDLFQRFYLSWMLGSGRAHFPETAALTAGTPPRRILTGPQRWNAIRRNEGMVGLIHRLAKETLWKLQTDI